jgi:hypothetical protein
MVWILWTIEIEAKLQDTQVSARTYISFQDSVAEYEILLKVWPLYSVHDKDRIQVGFEFELMGSHSHDSRHLDPRCRRCCHVRSVLRDIAEHFTKQLNSYRNPDLFCDVSHPRSVVCLPRYGNRPFVNVVISIRCSTERSLGECDISMLNDLKGQLGELGIRER